MWYSISAGAKANNRFYNGNYSIELPRHVEACATNMMEIAASSENGLSCHMAGERYI